MSRYVTEGVFYVVDKKAELNDLKPGTYAFCHEDGRYYLIGFELTADNPPQPNKPPTPVYVWTKYHVPQP